MICNDTNLSHKAVVVKFLESIYAWLMLLFLCCCIFFFAGQPVASKCSWSEDAVLWCFIPRAACVVSCLQQNSSHSNPRCISHYVQWFLFIARFLQPLSFMIDFALSNWFWYITYHIYSVLVDVSFMSNSLMSAVLEENLPKY